MVQDRKEPTFSSPSNKASLSDDAKQSNVQNTQQPSQRANTRPQVMIQKQPSSLLWIALLIALLASAASGYIFWQFTLSQKVVAEQQERLVELENKLLLSDDESTQSLTALTANVKGLDKNVSVAMSEVDKLWATRNANLKKLAAAKTELSTRIDETGKRIDKSDKSINASSSQSKKAIDAIDAKLKKSLVSIRQNSSEQELLLKSLRERSSEQSQTIKNLRSALDKGSNTDKVASLEQQLEQLSQQLNILSRRTKEYDEAIESFDKFRLTTNRDLITLKSRTGIAPQ